MISLRSNISSYNSEMANKTKNLKTCLMGLAIGLIVCFCLISLVNASDEGLVAYYSFDEGEGNVLHDDSGNSNDGTIYGAKWVEGKYGKALSFDGINDYVEVPDDSDLDITNAITLEAWINPAISPQEGGAPILAKGYGSGGEVYAVDTEFGNDLRFFIWNPLKVIAYTCVVGNWFSSDKVNKWRYVTATYDTSKGVVKIYENGNIIKTCTNFPTSSMKTNDHIVSIGSRESSKTSGYDLNFNGIIDEVRIYNRALTEDEIKADMVSPSPEMMKKVIHDTISKTKTKIDQLKKENINTETIEKIITSAEDALQKEAYKTALEQAQDASSKADKVWNAFQSYNSIKKEVGAKVDQLKREGIDTSIIEKSLSEAKLAFGNENFELAQQIVSDAESKADKSWSTYQYIETAKNAVKEAKGINCDASNAEKRINDAVDALNKGSYDTARQYASDAVSLAEKANCGKINIKDLKALAVKYDGRTVEISGKVRDIETVYGRGYKFTVDDGTGLITVGYEGSMKDVNNGDTINVEGVFSKYSDAIIVEKVEKSGLLGGGSIGGDSGDGIPIWLIIGIAGIIIVVAALFILKKNKGGEKGRRDVGEKI